MPMRTIAEETPTPTSVATRRPLPTTSGPSSWTRSARPLGGTAPAPDYNKCIDVHPQHARAWYNRGVAYNELGQPHKAVADYSRAIELDPKHVRAWYGRGLAYHRLGQPDKAVADLSKSIELAPN